MENARQYVEEGLTSTARVIVDKGNTASKCGSGQLDVYGTPFMIAAMERAALSAVDRRLPDGWITVGISMDVRHLAATPVGGQVEVEAELAEVEQLRLVFSVRASDDEELVGKGTHQRYCVHRESFLNRAKDKLS